MIFTEKEIYELLDYVKDPEIPAMSVLDMAIVRQVNISNNAVEVVITPTYSGCPAMKVIEDDIRKHLIESGIENLTVRSVLSPAWTTDWMSNEAKEKLRKSGIAPPVGNSIDNERISFLPIIRQINCPYCGSDNTSLESEFGSTACKSLYFCQGCKMPFDYFKCH